MFGFISVNHVLIKHFTHTSIHNKNKYLIEGRHFQSFRVAIDFFKPVCFYACYGSIQKSIHIILLV